MSNFIDQHTFNAWDNDTFNAWDNELNKDDGRKYTNSHIHNEIIRIPVIITKEEKKLKLIDKYKTWGNKYFTEEEKEWFATSEFDDCRFDILYSEALSINWMFDNASEKVKLKYREVGYFG